MAWYLHSAKFVLGVPDPVILPDTDIPEVAVIGRSNVGKSSLINRVTKHGKLARVSSTPGKTQEINLYSCTLERGSPKQKILFHLVDLPGFGYAKFSQEQRQEISRTTVEYLGTRPQLQIVLLLIDSKRLPGPDELAVQKTASGQGRHVIPILTKCDRLKRQEIALQSKAIARVLGLSASDLILTGDKMSQQNIIDRIAVLLET